MKLLVAAALFLSSSAFANQYRTVSRDPRFKPMVEACLAAHPEAGLRACYTESVTILEKQVALEKQAQLNQEAAAAQEAGTFVPAGNMGEALDTIGIH